MSKPYSWLLRLAVREGQLADARALMEEMVASTRNEVGTVGYEWFLSADGSTCHIHESFADTDAALVHAGNFGTHFADRFLACFEPTSLDAYGEPTMELKAVLDGFGATYLQWFGSSRRAGNPS